MNSPARARSAAAVSVVVSMVGRRRRQTRNTPVAVCMTFARSDDRIDVGHRAAFDFGTCRLISAGLVLIDRFCSWQIHACDDRNDRDDTRCDVLWWWVVRIAVDCIKMLHRENDRPNSNHEWLVLGGLLLLRRFCAVDFFWFGRDDPRFRCVGRSGYAASACRDRLA